MAVYEGAVDALAHLTLEGSSDKYRLSLGGVYAPKEGEAERNFRTPPALTAFLSRHPEVEELELCLDNDFAGRWAAEHMWSCHLKPQTIYWTALRTPSFFMRSNQQTKAPFKSSC